MPTLFTSPATLSGLPPATPLLVAFSGGADSRLLLELTVDWARANGAPVTAAHLHHGIRGAEADRQAFCRGVAAAHGIAYVCERATSRRAARSGRSLELEARLARSFFSRVMQARGIPLLLTAHHADDQLETCSCVFCAGRDARACRHPPVRPVPGGLLLPPADRDAAGYSGCLPGAGVTYVTDSTNPTDDCTRNCLRHRVVPLRRRRRAAGFPAYRRAAVRGGARGRQLPVPRRSGCSRPPMTGGTARCRSRHSGRCTPRSPSAVWHALFTAQVCTAQGGAGTPFPPTARRSTCICRRSPP